MIRQTLRYLATLGLVAAGLAALMTGSAPARAEIRIAVGCPPIKACGDWVWAEDVAKQLTAQGMPAKVFHSGALGKDPEVVDQLSQGLLQFGLTNFVMVKQVDPTVVGFLAPYMFDSNAHMFRAMDQSPIVKGIDVNLQKQGLKLAGFIGVGGPVGIFNTKHAVKTVADLKDLRLRGIDRSQIELFQAWGTKGVVVDINEVTSSLQKGLIDGYINPPLVPIIFKQLSLMKYYTDARIAYGFRSALISNDWYRKLKAEQRKIVDAAVKAANLRNRAWTEAAAKGEYALMKKQGVTITELTPAARAEFIKRSKTAWKAMMPADKIPMFIEAAKKARM